MADTTPTEPTKPYELLDSGMDIGGKLQYFGAKVHLTEEQAESLEPYGSIRPWGENDHDLVDDERDLPGILESAKGRENLARARIAKRQSGRTAKAKAPEAPMQKDTSGSPEKSGGRRN